MVARMRRALTFDDVMLVPQYNNVPSRSTPDLSTYITQHMKIKIPIVNSPMDTVINDDMARILWKMGTVPIFHRFYDLKSLEQPTKPYPYFITTGVRYKDDVGADLQTTIQWVNDHFPTCIGVLIDIAHGHSPMMIDAVRVLRESTPEQLHIIAGSVCTADGYRDLVVAGADAVRVGIGPGAACTTRSVTGFGVPQFTAISDCAEAAKKLRVPIIADGGIRNSADIVKALAAGATAVMLGKLLALTEESAAVKTDKVGRLEAKFRGQASRDFQEDRYGEVRPGTVPEGIDFWAPVAGPVETVVNELLAGVRSGLTYGGAKTIKELQRKAEFVEVTRNAIKENNPRVQ